MQIRALLHGEVWAVGGREVLKQTGSNNQSEPRGANLAVAQMLLSEGVLLHAYRKSRNSRGTLPSLNEQGIRRQIHKAPEAECVRTVLARRSFFMAELAQVDRLLIHSRLGCPLLHALVPAHPDEFAPADFLSTSSSFFRSGTLLPRPGIIFSSTVAISARFIAYRHRRGRLPIHNWLKLVVNRQSKAISNTR